MIDKTKEVIKATSENYSSMLQSFKKGKETEIMSINGKIACFGKKYKKDNVISKALISSIESLK